MTQHIYCQYIVTKTPTGYTINDGRDIVATANSVEQAHEIIDDFWLLYTRALVYTSGEDAFAYEDFIGQRQIITLLQRAMADEHLLNASQRKNVQDFLNWANAWLCVRHDVYILELDFEQDALDMLDEICVPYIKINSHTVIVPKTQRKIMNEVCESLWIRPTMQTF